MPDSPVPRVAVVGGGIAGLAAAWELSRHDLAVDLYESADRLGGRIQRRDLLGGRYDVGAESFAVRGGGVERLIADLGLGAQVQAPSGLRSWVVHPDLAAPLPPAGMLGIPVAPLGAEARRILGLRGALRAALEPLLPGRIGVHSTTVADAVRTRLGERVLTRLVAPVVRGVYSSDPEVLSVDAVPGFAAAWASHRSLTAAARTVRQSTQSAGAAVAGLRGGMGSLVEELERRLESGGVTIHRRSTVTSIIQTGSGLRLEVETGAGPGAPRRAELLDVDAAVLTAPGVRLTRDDGGRGSLVAQATAPPADPPTTVHIVAMLLDDPRLTAAPRGTGALVATEAHRGEHPILAKALTHSSAKWRWIADELPPDRHLIRLSYGHSPAAPAEHVSVDVAALSDDEMLRLACRDAGRILGVLLREGQVLGMARQSHVLPPRPSALSGSGQATTGIDGVFTAGEWVSGTGLAAVVPSARAAARACSDVVMSRYRVGSPDVR